VFKQKKYEPVRMPCNIEGHNHVWPTEGELVIEKCERYCGFCDEEVSTMF